MPPANSGSDQGPSKSAETASAGRPFTIQRVLAAPRTLVWKAWTEQQRLMQWFGPAGLTYVSGTFDLRPGGISLYCLRLPDGREMWGKWVFCDIVPLERLVFVNGFCDEKGTLQRHPMNPKWPLEMLTTVTFAESGGKTTLSLVWTPFNADDEGRKAFDGAFQGMEQGWGGTMAQLEAYLAKPGG